MAEMGLTLTCPAFIQGGPIAPLHTCDGMDTSPALQWSHTPPETSSFILLMEDADAPNGPRDPLGAVRHPWLGGRSCRTGGVHRHPREERLAPRGVYRALPAPPW